MGGFSDDRRVETIISGVREIDADLIIFPEGSCEDRLPSSARKLGDLYETMFGVSYNEQDPDIARPNQDIPIALGFIVMSKVDLGINPVTGVDNRDQMMLSAKDERFGQLVNVAGVHLDHRYESRRVNTLERVADQTPDIIMGDFNAMFAESWQARLFSSRLVSKLIDAIPHDDYLYMGRNLVEMTTGKTLETAREAGYEPADSRNHSTIKPSVKLPWFTAIAQIDHILFDPTRVTVQDHKVHKLPGSDHLPISAEVHRI